MSSGHMMMHLSMFFAILVIKKEELQGTCSSHEKESNISYSKEIKLLCLIHIGCFVCLYLAKSLEAFNPNFHLSEFLRIIAVTIYQFLVLRMQTNLIKMDYSFSSELCNLWENNIA